MEQQKELRWSCFLGVLCFWAFSNLNSYHGRQCHGRGLELENMELLCLHGAGEIIQALDSEKTVLNASFARTVILLSH